LSSELQPHVKDGLIFSVAIEHRLMNGETLSYMLHWLPLHLKQRLIFPACDFRPHPHNPAVRVERGLVQLGLHREDGQFGWDNEFEGHTVDVSEFEIDTYKVSNGEFLEFVDAGGYQEQSLWTEDSWQWINAEDIRHPKFWFRRGKEWWYHVMFGEIPLPRSWPVYVSQAEAAAYARWSNKSLPSEAEFQSAARSSGLPGQKIAIGNFDFQRWEPVPVDSAQQTIAGSGAVGLVGNGWEWTSNTFGPFPGFERFPFYPGYSADFFDNKHFVAKGASPVTASRLVRPSFRNWFQPHYPYIYAGFRCVQR
jgi:ergothioneine biosynthesis protein EgtB